MTSSHLTTLPGREGVRSAGPSDAHLMQLGTLCYLAGFCPLHKRFPAAALAALFFPAINNGCVRFFETANGATAAALIWARLSDAVSERMLFDKEPPDSREWAAGDNLWFLDLLAPFGHGGEVARHIARNPPDGPFYFARLDAAGKLRKVVRGDASARGARRVHAFLAGPDGRTAKPGTA